MIARVFRTGTAALSVVALAATFTAAPVAIGYGPFDAAAHAKGGNGGGKGGGKGGGASKSASAKIKAKGGGGGGSAKRRGGGSGIGGDIDRALGSLFGQGKKKTRTNRSSAKAAPKTAPRAAKRPTEEELTSLEEPLTPLRPDQKGRWNASNANQNALDAHIRNENFNGTIGALAFYQLAGKAAAGEDLTEDEQNALDNLLASYDRDVSDQELENLLNSQSEGPVWEVTDGAATCVDFCDGADTDAANQEISDYASGQAVDDLWTDAQQRIIDDSNKSTAGIEDQLLDELAHDLGFERIDPDADEGDPDSDPEVVILPEDEPLIILQ